MKTMMMGMWILTTAFSISDITEDCNVVVKDMAAETVVGKNIGFYVIFKNNSESTVDAIQYGVTYYNNFDDCLGTKNYTWQADDLDGPINSGNEKWDIHKNWMNDAVKISVAIKRIHFTNGTICNYSIVKKRKTINW